MDRLAASHRQILDLYYRAGLTYQEIADEFGVPIGTVMSRIHRARAALKDVVETVEEPSMEDGSNLEQRFKMEIGLLEALKVEADAADGITRVKHGSVPVTRLRQVLETHPQRLLDLLHLSETDDRLSHLAGVARSCVHATMPVMLSAALSDDATLSERATRMAEHWFTQRSHTRMRGLYLYLDALISSPAGTERKVALLVRLIKIVKQKGLFDDGHYVMFEMTRVLLGYPEEAFEQLWAALWELDPEDRVEYGVRKAIGHLVEPFTTAAVQVIQSGDRGRILRLLGEIRPVFSSRSVFSSTMPHPKALYEEMRVLLESDDSEIVARAKAIGVGYEKPEVSDLISRCTNPDRRVRMRALQNLGKRVEDSAKDVILDRVEHDDDLEVRKAAVQAYGRVAAETEKMSCLERIKGSGDSRLMKAAARALYVGSGPRTRTPLEEQRIKRIRGDAEPEKHIDPIGATRALPEIRTYDEEELTKIVAGYCTDYSTTRRQMVMEGRYALMSRSSGVYSFTQMGEATWRVGRFSEEARQALGIGGSSGGGKRRGPRE